ncbi:hypothetical protein SLOPH_667 [Spraguea lophii 42_110]|uniref:Uncharacterized protein n=1 Tax=Spraguea lophii (strain 42_110) TaxID=1358809 RepID=S7XV36_SPRLO|nr:hypothetical protein SLOPH_667 [Spraguea lophii 42_110]
MIIENIFGKFNIRLNVIDHNNHNNINDLENIIKYNENILFDNFKNNIKIRNGKQEIQFKITTLKDMCYNKIINKLKKDNYMDKIFLKEDKLGYFNKILVEKLNLFPIKIIKECDVCWKLSCTGKDLITQMENSENGEKDILKVIICSLRCYNRYFQI